MTMSAAPIAFSTSSASGGKKSSVISSLSATTLVPGNAALAAGSDPLLTTVEDGRQIVASPKRTRRAAKRQYTSGPVWFEAARRSVVKKFLDLFGQIADLGEDCFFELRVITDPGVLGAHTLDGRIQAVEQLGSRARG